MSDTTLRTQFPCSGADDMLTEEKESRLRDCDAGIIPMQNYWMITMLVTWSARRADSSLPIELSTSRANGELSTITASQKT